MKLPTKNTRYRSQSSPIFTKLATKVGLWGPGKCGYVLF